jgi:hypothetical protein
MATSRPTKLARFTPEAALLRARHSPDEARDAQVYAAATARVGRASGPERLELAREAKRTGSLAHARTVIEEVRSREAAGPFDRDIGKAIAETVAGIPIAEVSQYDAIARESRVVRAECEAAWRQLQGLPGSGLATIGRGWKAAGSTPTTVGSVRSETGGGRGARGPEQHRSQRHWNARHLDARLR